MTTLIPEKVASGQLCEKMVSGQIMSYRCTLQRGHEDLDPDDPEPCYATEVPRSTRAWQIWKRRQLLNTMPTHAQMEPDSACLGILWATEGGSDAVCDVCGRLFNMATARAPVEPPVSDHVVQVGETVTLEGSAPPMEKIEWTDSARVPENIPPPDYNKAQEQFEAIDTTSLMNAMLDSINSYKRGLTKAVNKALDGQGDEIKAGPIVKAVMAYGVEWQAENMPDGQR